MSMYFGKHTQSEAKTHMYNDPKWVFEDADLYGWEDCEWELLEETKFGVWPARFPCAYSAWTGVERWQCENPTNKPDSYCEVHSA